MPMDAEPARCAPIASIAGPGSRSLALTPFAETLHTFEPKQIHRLRELISMQAEMMGDTVVVVPILVSRGYLGIPDPE